MAGRPSSAASEYLLAGHASCRACGGLLFVGSRSHGRVWPREGVADLRLVARRTVLTVPDSVTLGAWLRAFIPELLLLRFGHGESASSPSRELGITDPLSAP